MDAVCPTSTVKMKLHFIYFVDFARYDVTVISDCGDKLYSWLLFILLQRSGKTWSVAKRDTYFVTPYIYVFRIVLAASSDCFPEQV
jgi:hypothetical protein